MKIVLLLVLLSVSECSSITSVIGQVGQNVTLPCRYNIKSNGVRPMCWGRGDIPNSGCNKELISTDGLKVITEGRYQLRGRLDEGDVSLTILNLTESDAGRYGCRVDIRGWFNDDIHHVDLTIKEATQTATKTSGYRETTTEPTQTYTAGQLTSTEMAFTSSSRSMRVEPQQESSSNVTMVLVLVLLGLLALVTAGGVLFITRRWRRLKMPQQQVSSLTPSTLQLHRRESVVENIYQIDGGEYEYCP